MRDPEYLSRKIEVGKYSPSYCGTKLGTEQRASRAAKKFNSENKSNKLNSKHLGLEGLEKPVYISENLTPKARRLFFRARELKRSKAYLFCWTSNGNVFIRKSEDDPAIPVESELQIDRLLPK